MVDAYEEDFVLVVAGALIGFSCYAAMLIFKYRKGVPICALLLAPLMLFLFIQAFAQFHEVTLVLFGLFAAFSCFSLDHFLSHQRRSLISANTKLFVDAVWSALPVIVVPPLLAAGLRQPLALEIFLPMTMLIGCALYLADYGRRRVRRTSAKGYRFGVGTLVIGGPLGVVLFMFGPVGGTLVYFLGVTLFYGGLIQLPTKEREIWSTRHERTEARRRLGFVSVLYGLSLMLVGVTNVIATA